MARFQLPLNHPIRQGFVVSSMRPKPPSAPSLPKEEPKASSLSDEQKAEARKMIQRAITIVQQEAREAQSGSEIDKHSGH